MSNLYRRTKDILGSKITKLIEKHEDPLETLDYAYEKQMEQLTKVRKGIADLTTAKVQLEQRKVKLCESLFTLDDQAKHLMEQNNEPLARTVLSQKVDAQNQIESLGKQIKNLRDNQANLTKKEQQLTLEVQQFKAKKEVMKAQYSAAKAQSEIAESLSGISNDTNGSDAIKRAGDKTETMQARASAIDELQATGVLVNSATDESSLDRDIRNANNQRKVDAEIEALRKK
jgi:phage shock protein A